MGNDICLLVQQPFRSLRYCNTTTGGAALPHCISNHPLRLPATHNWHPFRSHACTKQLQHQLEPTVRTAAEGMPDPEARGVLEDVTQKLRDLAAKGREAAAGRVPTGGAGGAAAGGSVSAAAGGAAAVAGGISHQQACALLAAACGSQSAKAAAKSKAVHSDFGPRKAKAARKGAEDGGLVLRDAAHPVRFRGGFPAGFWRVFGGWFGLGGVVVGWRVGGLGAAVGWVGWVGCIVRLHVAVCSLLALRWRCMHACLRGRRLPACAVAAWGNGEN